MVVSSALRDRRHLSRLLFLSQTWQPAIRPFSPDCKLPLCAAAGGEMDLFVERRLSGVCNDVITPVLMPCPSLSTVSINHTQLTIIIPKV